MPTEGGRFHSVSFISFLSLYRQLHTLSVAVTELYKTLYRLRIFPIFCCFEAALVKPYVTDMAVCGLVSWEQATFEFTLSVYWSDYLCASL